jgi:flagella basal body P-ring formation protein FlgA
VMRGGQEVDWRDVIFKLEYPCRQAVAANDIVKGQTISPENVRIETVYQSRPEKGWRGPYGLVARRDISAGSVISDIMVASPKPEVVIKRRQTVMVRYENGPLSLTAMGQAMEEGTAGSFIKVRMQITNHARIIYARVLDDGTVEPVI